VIKVVVLPIPIPVPVAGAPVAFDAGQNGGWQKLPRPRYPAKTTVEPPTRDTQPIPDRTAKQALDEARRMLAEHRAQKLWRELAHPS
jgi:hypothetical protein